ncbi:hypothetical protein [Nocardia sp. NPDC004123]
MASRVQRCGATIPSCAPGAGRAAAGRFRSPETLPLFFAAVRGSRDGLSQLVLARVADDSAAGAPLFIDDMSRATGIPLALGLSQVIDGTARRPGVHPPEALIDPDRFFRDLRPHLGDIGDGPAVVVERVSRTAASAH